MNKAATAMMTMMAMGAGLDAGINGRVKFPQRKIQPQHKCGRPGCDTLTNRSYCGAYCCKKHKEESRGHR